MVGVVEVCGCRDTTEYQVYSLGNLLMQMQMYNLGVEASWVGAGLHPGTYVGVCDLTLFYYVQLDR